jgi:hypothetical protein
MSAKALLSASVSAGPAAYVEDVFSTYLYTGNGSTQTITNGIDLSGEGGLVWVKNRSGASIPHYLQDSARGFSNIISSNTTAAQEVVNFVSPTSSGFNWAGATWGDSGYTFASWTFRKAEKFFDVVTYVGDGNTTKTVSHNLGSVPGSIIAKGTSAATDWPVYHRSLNGGTTPEQWYLGLNSTAAQTNAVANWGNVAPTSTTFTVGGNNNANGISYVAYLFAHDAGGFGDAGTDSVVKCGSVVGSSQVEVNLGWEPQWILVKNASSAQDWWLVDNMRGLPVQGTDTSYNASNLRPNLSDAETTGFSIAPSATGFKANVLSSGQTYIYIAIRRGPMRTPESGTEVFNTILQSPQSAGSVRTVGFPADVIFGTARNSAVGTLVNTRLTGFANTSGASQNTKSLFTYATAAETDRYPLFYDVWNTTAKDGDFIYASNGVNHFFRRAPGFFDVVAWTASASTSITHGLGVTPELIIAKSRSVAGESWAVYTQAGGRGNVLFLDTTNSNVGIADYWGTSGPTATTFGVAASGSGNNAGNMIAYLFATLPGISKVGSYTGTGTTLSIDCGFTAGARFVLIKRTDSTGDWYVWDTARGIISGDDPYLLLNSSAAEVTNTDYIDPLSSGFQISSTAPAAINASGGSFIFLAIA